MHDVLLAKLNQTRLYEIGGQRVLYMSLRGIAVVEEKLEGVFLTKY